MASAQPLAARMRPRDLAEFVGQPHLVGEGRMLRRAIDAGQIPSMILWGPPGTGKTTLAAIAAQKAKARFVAISAVSSGVVELRKIIEESRKLRQLTNQGTVLFIDEIHRFNKAQQDVVLPYVEKALERVDALVLEQHLETCVADAFRQGRSEKTIKELAEIFSTARK